MSAPPSQQGRQSNPIHPPSRFNNDIINPSLMKLKLLEVLRNNDTSKLLDLIKQIDNNNNNNNNNNQSNYDLIKLKNELLLFAVQVGPLSIVKYIIENNLIDDINSQDLDGNTALHLAAISNRNDIVEYLMKNPNINDCLYNKDLKQPIQCTTNIETAQLMDFLRTKHIEKIASQLRNGFETRNFELLDQLLSNPRDKELLDINGTDPITTDTVLIEFIKKNDYEMVKFILNHGGDPFKRSLSGKSPEESTNDIKMKQIIEDSFSQQNIIESTTNHPQDGSPTYKGFLKKWTNFAGGYKLRWFVLDHQAILSYYKSPNDMNNTCRGLIHLAHAMLKVDSSENTKFEIIIQNPSDGSPVRWHLKANHATEAQKWIWILQNAIRFAKDFEKKQRKSIVLSHILNEDLPQSSPYNNNNNNNNHPHQQQQLHSPLDHHPATIPESDVLSNDMIIQENEDRKPTVESIISDANEASNDFKQLIKITDSESDLPLKNNLDNNNTNNNNNNNVNVNVNANEIYDNINNTNTNDQNTNTSLSDSLRNQIGPVPDRRSQYSGSGSSKLDSYNHNRAISVSSFTSNKSNNSDVSASKSSFTKKLYKKPLKQLSKIGKKTRQSFVVQNQSQPNSLAPINSAASFNSNASSALSSPDSHLNNGFGNNFIENNNNNNLEEVIDDENDDDDDEEEEEEGEEEENSSKKIVTTDLNVVRNQMTIQLKTFKDFLKSASIDDTISKNDLVEMSISILNTLDILINQEGDCVNIKYNELIRRLDKQQKISSIWENSIKQLEIEIHQRESKIVELEDKLKAVKKSLRNSVNHLHSSHLYTSAENVPTILPVEKDQQSGNATSAAALARQALTANLNRKSVIPPIPTSQPPFEEIEQQKEENHALQQQKEIQQKYQVHEALKTEVPIYPPPPVPFDPTLTEFLEESDDSDDEFFDAEESDEVKDMAVLERRETLKALKRRQSKIEKQNGEVVIPPPIPSEMPPPIPSLQVELNVPTIKTPENIYYNEPLEEEESSLQKSQTLIVNEPEKFEQTDISNEELPEANFKPHIDKYGRYVVNKHELMSESQTIRYGKILKEHSFEGYEDPLRLSLAPEDNRPKISLWGVLKSLVGKDMTKMTLPVSFNEPTSLLQRNVEVIEYSDLLDKASAIDNSTLRLVYVATFAASEYASTVGRIAKPFNPLLGETFEYTRSDKGYRCFVEQVSHHPPISALIAESPSWSYYGESNVKTKFLGRSFDIKHLGTWFCEVFPDAGVQCKNGKVSEKEVYSWKKVNNSVIGIIVGNPTIDNYGSMEIQNHMTGDYMKFEFKPRGWRASSAYEVKGEVFNAKGKLMYYVGGHWNSKIFCKPADDKNAERFLIWEAAPRQEMMFHLTNFAATLNAPLPHLLPKVACTDTRLRPDQRAMEDGDYDLAAAEKNRVEEKQREARRQREMKGETYEPTFFTRDNHPITGEEFWKYKGSYWSDRKAGKLINYKDIF